MATNVAELEVLIAILSTFGTQPFTGSMLELIELREVLGLMYGTYQRIHRN